MGDKFLSFNKLDKYPISHISEVSSFESFKKAIDSTGQSSDSAEELRQLFLTAFKVYKDGWSNVKKTMSALEVSRYESIQRSIDSFSQDWISQSHLALQAVVYSSGGSNVCIGGGHLIANLSKLLLFDLSEFFDAENIYATESKSDVGKKREFLKILDRFGPHCRYIHLGSGDVDFKDFDEIQKLNPSISLEFHAIERPEDLARLTQRIQEGGFA